MRLSALYPSVLFVCILFVACVPGNQLPAGLPESLEGADSVLSAACEICDDSDVCTVDVCSEATNYICQHEAVVPCCGNGICEADESTCSCAEDCGSCEKTASACSTYKCVNGSCELITQVPCCGNGICERGEHYLSCADDCPDCDDLNSCTDDYYDYSGGECVHDYDTPCCGNGVCDGSESCNTCPLDCRCRLTADLSDYPDIFSGTPVIIVGDTAPAEDVLSAANIGTPLNAQSVLASEIDSITGKNIISIGNPCDNRHTHALLGRPDCASVLAMNQAEIRLLANGDDAVAMLVMGYTSEDTRRASLALVDPDRYDLSGTDAYVYGTLSRITVKKVK
ncbi:MAG: hypothetical protein ABH879_07810 [archaeon]